jgi:hypothetical protein
VTGAPEPPPAPAGQGDDGGRLGGYAGRRGQLPTWPRVAIVVALFLFTFFVAKSCQDEQVRLSQEEAIALASDQVDFEPENTQIRLLRQGLDRRPVWVVSLSIPKGKDEGPDPDVFKRLALVRIDANQGTVESVEEQDTPESP